MGCMTLEQIMVEVSMNLGGRAPGPERLKTWVNYAVLDLATENLFDELRTTETFSVLDGVTEYGEPEGLLGIVDIKVYDRSLRKMRRLYVAAETPSQPLYYLRKDNSIVIL